MLSTFLSLDHAVRISALTIDWASQTFIRPVWTAVNARRSMILTRFWHIVVVRRVYALIELLRIGSSRFGSPLQKLHQTFQSIGACGTIGSNSGKSLSVGLAQPGGISTRCWVFDSRELRIDLSSTFFLGPILARVGVGEKLQLLRIFGRSLRPNFRGGLHHGRHRQRRAMTVSSSKLAVECWQHGWANWWILRRGKSRDGYWRWTWKRGRWNRATWMADGGFGIKGYSSLWSRRWGIWRWRWRRRRRDGMTIVGRGGWRGEQRGWFWSGGSHSVVSVGVGGGGGFFRSFQFLGLEWWLQINLPTNGTW